MQRPSSALACNKGVELIPEFYADLEYDGDGNLILSRVHDAVDPMAAKQRVLRVIWS